MNTDDMKNKKQGKKKTSTASIIGISVSLAVIAVCGVVVGLSLASFFGNNSNNPSLESSPPTSSVAPSEEVSDSTSFKPYILNTSGCSALSAAIGLAETDDAYGSTPAYVFVGQMVKKESDEIKDSEASESPAADAESENGSKADYSLQMAATRELLNVARDTADNWTIPYEEIANFLSECICLHSDKYIIIIGDERYAPMAQIFEAAVEDPSILDFEDLVARLSSFQAGG